MNDKAFVTRIHYSYGPARKEPKAGDLKFLKGRGAWMIRQQEYSRYYCAYVVNSRGKPAWEWVERGGERDRKWQSDFSRARDYFEKRCHCIGSGELPVRPDECNHGAFMRYMKHCKCSVHPEYKAAQP